MTHIGDFEAWLDDELLCVSERPRGDAAAVLLERGYPPDSLMTARAYNRDYDSWVPQPILECAIWSQVRRKFCARWPQEAA